MLTSIIFIYLCIIHIHANIVSKMYKFVDDTKLSHRDRNSYDITELQEDIINVLSGQTSGILISMLLNILCCTSCITTWKATITSSISQVPTARQQRDLGIIITKDLNLHKQTEKSCETRTEYWGYYKSRELILPLCKSIVSPHLEYAVQFWSPHLRRDIDKMVTIQRRATQIILEI